MREASFFVPGKPKGKGRPQFNRKTRRAYTPKETREYEEQIAFAYVKQCGVGFQGYVYVEITAIFKIPKSWPKSKRRLVEEGRIYPSRPDVDNIEKAVLDGLNHVAYADDAAVVGAYCTKDYEHEEMPEGLYIRIVSLEGGGERGRKKNAAKGV